VLLIAKSNLDKKIASKFAFNRDEDYRPYSKSKLELNSKKVQLERCKKFSSVFLSFFFALKARLQILEFEFCQIKLG